MTGERKISTMAEFHEYAAYLDRIEELKMELLDAMSGDVPKSVSRPGWEKMDAGETKLRSDLEDRMFTEHPRNASTKVFYGGDTDE